jgi:hypothetical protein
MLKNLIQLFSILSQRQITDNISTFLYIFTNKIIFGDCLNSESVLDNIQNPIIFKKLISAILTKVDNFLYKT